MILTTLLSMGGGFLARLLPELIDLWKLKINNKHELALQRLSLEASKQKLDSRERVRNIDADLADARSLRAYALAERKLLNQPVPKTGMPWVDAINSLIRAIVTLWVLSVWTYCKLVKVEFVASVSTCGEPVFVSLDLLEEVWGEEDTAMLGAIIGYHFGAQAAKFLRRYAGR